MFRIVELEYPCFDTDLISPSSMTKGKEELPCVLNDVSVYLHSSCASRVSRCIGVTGLTVTQISERLLNQNLKGKVKRKTFFLSRMKEKKVPAVIDENSFLLNFPFYVVMKTCENLFRNLIKFNMTKGQSLHSPCVSSSLDGQTGGQIV